MKELPPPGDIRASKQRFLFCARQGLFRHAVPASKGGRGDSFTDLTAAHEALGKSCLDSGLLLSINAHLWGALFPLLNYGNAAQQQTYLAKLLSGEFIGVRSVVTLPYTRRRDAQ